MTSSIFNFRLGAVLLAAALLGAAELAVRRAFETPETVDVAAQLQSSQPDLILVGGSILQRNVDEKLLETELSRRTGRTIRVFGIARGGAVAPLWYLIAKRVRAGNRRNVPVGFVGYGAEDFLSKGRGGSESSLVKAYLERSDEAFVEKYWDASLSWKLWLRPYCAACYYSPEASRILLRDVVNFMYQAVWPGEIAQRTLRRSLNTNSGGFNLVASSWAYTEVPASQNDFERSFMPDIIETLRGTRLFVILSAHRRKEISKEDEYSLAKRYFQSSLRPYDIPLLDLSEVESLRAPEYYADAMHMNEHGRRASTMALAEAIFSAGLVRVQ